MSGIVRQRGSRWCFSRDKSHQESRCSITVCSRAKALALYLVYYNTDGYLCTYLPICFWWNWMLLTKKCAVWHYWLSLTNTTCVCQSDAAMRKCAAIAFLRSHQPRRSRGLLDSTFANILSHSLCFKGCIFCMLK